MMTVSTDVIQLEASVDVPYAFPQTPSAGLPLYR
jgi:hypothetical protein